MKRLTPKDMTDAEKTHVWSSITPYLSAHTKKSPMFASLWRKTTAFVLVATLVMGGGLATASAHYDVMPGDFLFPVEVATEKAQIFLAGNSRAKESLRIKFAEKRLEEVKTLIKVSEAAAQTTINTGGASSTTQVSGTTTVQTPSTTTPYYSKDALKQIERTERAITIALAELAKTRATLASSGSQDGLLIIDDIIAELRGAGDGSVTITKIAAKGNSGKVSIRATFADTSTSTGGGGFSGTVRIEETKRGAKITMNDSAVSTSMSVRATNTPSSQNGKHEDDDHDKSGKKDHDDEDEDDGDDDKSHGNKKTKICHRSDDSLHTIEISISAARAHLAHGDTLGTCHGDGSTGTTTPDTTAPSIDAISFTPSTGSASLTWTTSEGAKTKLWVSATNSPDTALLPTQEEATLASSHSMSLTGLTPATLYRVILSATDAAGNRATSTERTFTTSTLPPPADVTAPVVSSIEKTVATTTALITWNTNEPSGSALYFATGDPISGTVLTNNTLLLAHDAALSGLTSSTTYRFIIVAKDSSGNTATTSESTFTTL